MTGGEIAALLAIAAITGVVLWYAVGGKVGVKSLGPTPDPNAQGYAPPIVNPHAMQGGIGIYAPSGYKSPADIAYGSGQGFNPFFKAS